MAAAEETATVDFHFTGVPKKTEREKVQELFEAFGGTLRFFKDKSLTVPFGFVAIPEDKVDEVEAAEFKIGDTVITVTRSYKSVNYFLDSRDDTHGDLNKLTEEQLTTYFSQYGEVLEVKIVEEKGFGFLKMKKDPDNMEVETLAFNLHTIEEQVINVQEKDTRRKRRRGKGGWRNNKRQKKES